MAQANKNPVLSSQTLVPIGLLMVLVGGIFCVASMYITGVNNSADIERARAESLAQKEESLAAIEANRREMQKQIDTIIAELVLQQANSKNLEITLVRFEGKLDEVIKKVDLFSQQ